MIKQKCDSCGIEIYSPENMKYNDCPQTYTCSGELKPCNE